MGGQRGVAGRFCRVIRFGRRGGATEQDVVHLSKVEKWVAGGFSNAAQDERALPAAWGRHDDLHAKSAPRRGQRRQRRRGRRVSRRWRGMTLSNKKGVFARPN